MTYSSNGPDVYSLSYYTICMFLLLLTKHIHMWLLQIINLLYLLTYRTFNLVQLSPCEQICIFFNIKIFRFTISLEKNCASIYRPTFLGIVSQSNITKCKTKKMIMIYTYYDLNVCYNMHSCQVAKITVASMLVIVDVLLLRWWNEMKALHVGNLMQLWWNIIAFSYCFQTGLC